MEGTPGDLLDFGSVPPATASLAFLPHQGVVHEVQTWQTRRRPIPRSSETRVMNWSKIPGKENGTHEFISSASRSIMISIPASPLPVSLAASMGLSWVIQTHSEWNHLGERIEIHCARLGLKASFPRHLWDGPRQTGTPRPWQFFHSTITKKYPHSHGGRVGVMMMMKNFRGPVGCQDNTPDTTASYFALPRSGSLRTRRRSVHPSSSGNSDLFSQFSSPPLRSIEV